MEFSNIVPGISFEQVFTVEHEDTAAFFGNKSVPVLASPKLLAWMEGTCIEAVKPFLPNGFETVGTTFEFKHLAATPTGMEVRVVVELVEVNGKLLTFQTKAYDNLDKICEGTHGRAIIDLKKFMSRVHEKANKH